MQGFPLSAKGAGWRGLAKTEIAKVGRGVALATVVESGKLFGCDNRFT
jgi:hypothetical protein